ncbi:MAG: hypothetical protein QOC23_10095, partial [Nitrososphaeraceae archaeon]|nr:hypothetical protein [Nitrososphaeraceae archaeon]
MYDSTVTAVAFVDSAGNKRQLTVKVVLKYQKIYDALIPNLMCKYMVKNLKNIYLFIYNTNKLKTESVTVFVSIFQVCFLVGLFVEFSRVQTETYLR